MQPFAADPVLKQTCNPKRLRIKRKPN